MMFKVIAESHQIKTEMVPHKDAPINSHHNKDHYCIKIFYIIIMFLLYSQIPQIQTQLYINWLRPSDAYMRH